MYKIHVHLYRRHGLQRYFIRKNVLLFHLENYFYFGYKIFIPDNIQDLLFLIDFPNICQPESHQSQRAQTAIFSTAVENNYYFYDALTREGKNGGGRKIIYIYTHTHMHVLKAFPLLPLPIEPNESLSLPSFFFFFFYIYSRFKTQTVFQ